MPATLIDGKAIAEQINAETVVEIARLKDQYRVTPGLAVILVGENPASATYVSMKDKMCARLGMHSERVNLPVSTSEGELLASHQRLSIFKTGDPRHPGPIAAAAADFGGEEFSPPSIRPRTSTVFIR